MLLRDLRPRWIRAGGRTTGSAAKRSSGGRRTSTSRRSRAAHLGHADPDRSHEPRLLETVAGMELDGRELREGARHEDARSEILQAKGVHDLACCGDSQGAESHVRPEAWRPGLRGRGAADRRGQTISQPWVQRDRSRRCGSRERERARDGDRVGIPDGGAGEAGRGCSGSSGCRELRAIARRRSRSSASRT